MKNVQMEIEEICKELNLDLYIEEKEFSDSLGFELVDMDGVVIGNIMAATNDIAFSELENYTFIHGIMAISELEMKKLSIKYMTSNSEIVLPHAKKDDLLKVIKESLQS